MIILIIEPRRSVYFQCNELILNNVAKNIDVSCYSHSLSILSPNELQGTDALIVDAQSVGPKADAFISRIMERNPKLTVMMHSDDDDKDTALSAIKAGAVSYVVPHKHPGGMQAALAELMQGGTPMSPIISQYVVQELQRASGVTMPNILTMREKQVFRCIEEGLTYKRTSQALNITPHTVHSHLKNIYSKLQAKNKHHALDIARKMATA